MSKIKTVIVLTIVVISILNGCSNGLIKKINDFISVGMFKEAKELLDKELLEDPKNEILHLWYGNVLTAEISKQESALSVEERFDYMIYALNRYQTAFDLRISNYDPIINQVALIRANVEIVKNRDNMPKEKQQKMVNSIQRLFETAKMLPLDVRMKFIDLNEGLFKIGEEGDNKENKKYIQSEFNKIFNGIRGYVYNEIMVKESDWKPNECYIINPEKNACLVNSTGNGLIWKFEENGQKYLVQVQNPGGSAVGFIAKGVDNSRRGEPIRPHIDVLYKDVNFTNPVIRDKSIKVVKTIMLEDFWSTSWSQHFLTVKYYYDKLDTCQLERSEIIVRKLRRSNDMIFAFVNIIANYGIKFEEAMGSEMIRHIVSGDVALKEPLVAVLMTIGTDPQDKVKIDFDSDGAARVRLMARGTLNTDFVFEKGLLAEIVNIGATGEKGK
ncbi:MAG: hypothetical protein Q8N51_01130 [Gammaproteobacteria bacterium]|nr:hypothetical protein [Gammaproteobacteria bacterium]